MIKFRRRAMMPKIDAIDTVPGSELIQDTFLFKFLNFDETMAMTALCRREVRKPGEPIIEEGELGQALYLIVSGHVRVYKGQGETEQTLAMLGRGELFGEMSLIENDLTSATVVADSDVELLTIARPDLEQLMETNRDLALKIFKTFCQTLSERLRKTSDELAKYRELYENK
jgi:CRP/FNR family transcriptional regulator, cyclic AMP receptor protein